MFFSTSVKYNLVYHKDPFYLQRYIQLIYRILFADDTEVSNAKIRISDTKTQTIIFPFNKSPKRIPSINLTIQGTITLLQDSIKYLGVTLVNKLTFKQHVQQTCIKAIRCGRALFPLQNWKSSLNVKNKILLYRMCTRPLMT